MFLVVPDPEVISLDLSERLIQLFGTHQRLPMHWLVKI
jgi:hypothetical protein